MNHTPILHMRDLRNYRPADQPSAPEEAIALACLIIVVCAPIALALLFGWIKV